MTVSSLQERPASGAAETGADAVLRIALTDFRCYGALRIEADGRPVVLAGPNGAGKTNLLEALSMLAPGRGLRRAPFAELGRREAGAAPGTGRPWAVAASVAAPGGAVEIGTGTAGTAPPAENEGDDVPATRRQVRIDGRPAQPAALAGQVGLAWLTPEMDRMFNESASSRRRFLDRLAGGLDRSHATRLNAYERALRERARLLRDGRFGGPRPDPAWLAALEREMAEHGIAVAAVRADTVQRLNAACAKGVGPFPAARLVLLDGTETMLAEMPALDAEEVLRARLADSRARDAEAGGAAVGPHRSDFDTIFIANGRSAADCSTGEQKALLISIVLADARLRALEHGAAPVLLLDEVAAHLDEGRREALFDEIAALGCQAWMTGTDAAMFAPLGARAQYFAVHAGLVTPA